MMRAAPASDGSAAISWVFWFALALACICSSYSVLGARDLAYDGCYYLLGVANHGDFQYWEPTRQSVHFMQQLFAVAGARSGLNNLWSLAQLFSLGAESWPLAITAMCWFVLPHGEKSWIAGPLLNLVFAVATTSFMGIGEGIIASCLLWLAFLLASFRLKETLGAFACIGATALCCFVHESAVLCLLIIAAAAVGQLRQTRGWARAAAICTAFLAVAGALNMLRWILFPPSSVERADFLASLLGEFLGTVHAPNLAVLASIVAAAVIAAILLHPKRSPVAAVAIGYSIFAMLLVVQFVWPDDFIAPSRFFAARGLPVALTTVLAAGALWMRTRGLSPIQFATRSICFVLLGLIVTQTAMQFSATNQWNAFVHDLEQFVRIPRGAVTHQQAMQALDPGGGRFRRELLEHWSIEPLSVLLAPSGHVQTVVLAAPWVPWVPYRPGDPETYARAPELDWSRFLRQQSL